MLETLRTYIFRGRKTADYFLSTPTAPPTALFLAAARLERGLQTVGRGSSVGTALPEGPNKTRPYPDALNLWPENDANETKGEGLYSVRSSRTVEDEYVTLNFATFEEMVLTRRIEAHLRSWYVCLVNIQATDQAEGRQRVPVEIGLTEEL